MNSFKLFVLFGTSIFLYNAGELTLAKTWAVILIGNQFFYHVDYAFEATGYKQYNDLVRNGIPPENIIVISPDKVAYNENNPMPGVITYAYEGAFSPDFPVNQYENVTIDYKLTSALKTEHLFQILSGKRNSNLTALGSGRVVESGSNDNVFLYISTSWRHPGSFFLNYRLTLEANIFIPFIEDLAKSKSFKSMFISAHCASGGSMFDDIMDTNSKILAYAFGGRYNDLTMCHFNEYLSAYTSVCQGYEYFTYMDKAVIRNGARETVLDLFTGTTLSSNNNEIVYDLYGDFSLAYKPIKEFYGPNMKNSQPLTFSEIMELKTETQGRTKNGKSILKILTEEIPLVKEQDRNEYIRNQIIMDSINNNKIWRNIIDERGERLRF